MNDPGAYYSSSETKDNTLANGIDAQRSARGTKEDAITDHTAVGAYDEETIVGGIIGVCNMVSPMRNNTSSNTRNTDTNIIGDGHEFVGRNLAQQILDARENESAELAAKGPDPDPVNDDN